VTSRLGTGKPFTFFLQCVYRDDVNSLSVSSLSFNPVTWKCSSCPNNHSVLEANNKGGRCVIVLADQNFPAVLPSAENLCLVIIRLESGSLDELIDLFLKISRPVTVPEGRSSSLGLSPLCPRSGCKAMLQLASMAVVESLVQSKGCLLSRLFPPPPPRRVQ
jgi:hypothetical protein